MQRCRGELSTTSAVARGAARLRPGSQLDATRLGQLARLILDALGRIGLAVAQEAQDHVGSPCRSG
jgi:hypothetical protein